MTARGEERYDVPQITLDDFTRDRGIDSVDFLKVDAEGHDLHVLEGASRLLSSSQIAMFMFEFNDPWIVARRFLQEAAAFLESKPYRLFRLFNGFFVPILLQPSCRTPRSRVQLHRSLQRATRQGRHADPSLPLTGSCNAHPDNPVVSQVQSLIKNPVGSSLDAITGDPLQAQRMEGVAGPDQIRAAAYAVAHNARHAELHRLVHHEAPRLGVE